MKSGGDVTAKNTDRGRKLEEFWCDKGGGGCGCYFMTYLRENMTGAYTIECANERSMMDTVVSWRSKRDDFRKAKVKRWGKTPEGFERFIESTEDAEKLFADAKAKGLTIYALPLEAETKGEAQWRTFDTFSPDFLEFYIPVPCKHHHYRWVESGLITTNRNYKAQEQKEIIKGLGPVRMTPYHDDPEFRRSLMRKVKG